MSRATKLGLALCMALGMTAGAAHADAQAANPECRFGLGRRAMRQTVVCVANKYSRVSRSTALYVANRESNFYAHARNGSSGACGIYQHYPASGFSARYRTYYGHRRWGTGPNNCFNGRTNIIVSLTMVQRGGWGPWS